MPSASERRETFEELQRRLTDVLGGRALSDLTSGTLVVVPSLSFPTSELRKIVGIQHYEQRLLFLLLLLTRPELNMTFVSCLPVDEAVIDYYLSFVGGDARDRLRMISAGDGSARGLTEKILERPDVVNEIAWSVASNSEAFLLPFNVTGAERELSVALQLPLYGPHPDVTHWGTKSGARRAARAAGVAIPPGAEHLTSIADVEHALRSLARDGFRSAVVKLNNGFSGQGNAIVRLDEIERSLFAAPVTFCADDESWATYTEKIEREGAIVEAHITSPGRVSPSVQARIGADRSFEIVSSHDQILGGPDDQVYLGCRFSAHSSYRSAIKDATRKITAFLADQGVIGSFGIDFLVDPDGDQIYLSEINLRMGGTTHPFFMAKYALDAEYDDDSGDLRFGGEPRFYVATDNLKESRYIGMKPREAVAVVEEHELSLDRSTGIGITLHLLGALEEYGKLGAVCIGRTMHEANDLLMRLRSALDGLADAA